MGGFGWGDWFARPDFYEAFAEPEWGLGGGFCFYEGVEEFVAGCAGEEPSGGEDAEGLEGDAVAFGEGGDPAGGESGVAKGWGGAVGADGDGRIGVEAAAGLGFGEGLGEGWEVLAVGGIAGFKGEVLAGERLPGSGGGFFPGCCVGEVLGEDLAVVLAFAGHVCRAGLAEAYAVA